MDTRGIEQMIGQLRATADVAGSKGAAAGEVGGADFSSALATALQQVSQAQAKSTSKM